jgi:hypothetical protein
LLKGIFPDSGAYVENADTTILLKSQMGHFCIRNEGGWKDKMIQKVERRR